MRDEPLDIERVPIEVVPLVDIEAQHREAQRDAEGNEQEFKRGKAALS